MVKQLQSFSTYAKFQDNERTLKTGHTIKILPLMLLIIACTSVPVTYHFSQDLTSSGGTRLMNATVTYVDGKAVSGTFLYESWPGMGNYSKTSCTYANNHWTKNQNEECDEAAEIPLTLTQLDNEARARTIQPLRNGECGHRELCYWR